MGSAICDYMESLGWQVTPVDKRSSNRPGAIELDMADAEAIQDTLSTLGRVDALVNNAAVQLFRSLLETEVDEWDHVHAVNLRAAWLCTRALASRLAERGGAVVNIGSVHAAATSLEIGAYATMKGGVSVFTRAAALELAPLGIRVNCIHPGAIETPALRAGFVRRADAEAGLIARTPLKRIGDPRDIATLAAFLLDGDLSGFITGSSIAVDGGVLAQLSSE